MTNTCIFHNTHMQDINIINPFLATHACSIWFSLNVPLFFNSSLVVSIFYRNIDIFPVHQLHLQDPVILGLKKEGDEKFQAQLYEEAAAFYTIALNYPTLPFMDTSVIAEKLFRKRAVCFYKMVS